MRRRITTAKREEIEKEQKLLDTTIVRPFETLEGLPISYNPPPNGHYEDVLKNPLTIKDSAVLYNSLIRSRNTYVQHAPMFKLYWVKQSAYAKKLAEMEKDKEVTRERESRRRFGKATSNSMEARTRTPVLSTDVNARDVMSKLCESSITLGPHSMEIRIFIAKDARSEKSRAFAEISKVSEYESAPIPPVQPGSPAATDSISAPSAVPNAVPATSTSAVAVNPSTAPVTASEAPGSTPLTTSLKTSPATSTSSPAASKQSILTTASPGQPATNSSPKLTTSSRGSSLPVNTTAEPAKSLTNVASPVLSKTGASQATKNDPKLPQNGINTGSQPASGSISLNTQSSSVPTKPTNIQSELSNAQNGSTTGLSPSMDLKSFSNQPSQLNSVKVSGPSSATAPTQSVGQPAGRPTQPPPPPPPAANLQSIDNLIMISNLNAIAKIDLSLNDLMKVVALGSASEAQITHFKKYIERAKQMGPQPHHADLYFSRNIPLPPNFPRPRPYVERRPPKPKIPNPLKLTAFQEKYLHNATLVFEFLENPNVRYVIPKDSICEVLEAENPPKDSDEEAGFKDILLSHIWIHNIDEVEVYEKQLAEYTAEIKKKEEEEEKKRKEQEEAEKKGGTQDANKIPAAAEERNLRTKKKQPPPKKKKALEKPEEPPIRYTTLSFTLHNIPLRFVPIVMNSLKPLDQVHERMSHILKNGTRVNSFYLWYQVDARLDEGVAESLRHAAVQEEKKMQGIMAQGSNVEIKKRKPRELKNPKPKRSKEATPSYAPVSMAQPVKQETATI